MEYSVCGWQLGVGVTQLHTRLTDHPKGTVLLTGKCNKNVNLFIHLKWISLV